MQDNYTGALLDNRDDVAKSKDYSHLEPELASASQVVWLEKKVEDWKDYPSRNQLNSSSCVAQAIAKAMLTLGYGVDSAHPIYRSRMNFAGVGMYLYDAVDIAKKKGTVLETQDISQNVGEDVMNQDIANEVQKILDTEPLKISGYVYVQKSPNWFEDIARAVQDNKHCVITVQSNYNEWSSIPQIQGEPKWGHAVCVTDYVLYQGKKYLVIEDSWGSNIGQFDDRRLLSEEFIMSRCTGAVYLLKDVPIVLPQGYKFTRTLQFGMYGDDVKKLQDALKALGFLASGVNSTGYYGTLTLKAVNKFQLAFKSDILTPVGLDSPTGIFGTNSIKKMNQILMKNKWFLSSTGNGDLSLAIKGAMLGIVPVIITLASMSGLEITQDQIVQVINQIFTVVSAVVVLIGLIRKIYNTYKR